MTTCPPPLGMILPMRKIHVLLVFALGWVLSVRATPAPIDSKDASELLRQGLFEEEANRDLDKAAAAYTGVVQLYDAQHNLAATAVFRLAEIRAKQGDKAEAARLYQRMLTDFADQDTLAKLSRERLVALGAPASPAPNSSETPIDEEGKAMARILARYPNGTVEPGVFDGVTDEAPYNGRTPMIYAADKGWVRLLTFMLENGGMVDGWSHTGGPIRAAAATGQRDAVALLLAHGAHIDTADPDGWTALHAACLGRHAEIVGLLLDKGAKTDVFCARKPDPKTIPVHAWGPDLPKWLPAWKDIPLGTPLLIAARNGDVDILTRLLDHRADPNFYAEPGANDKAPLSPLLVALYTGQKATARLLLERGANARFATPEGFTILHAAAAGTPDMVIPLLDLGLKQPADANGWTPLFYSVYLGGSRHNLNEAKGEERLTPLPEFMDRLTSYEAAWDALAAHGADVNVHDSISLTLMHYCVPDDYHPLEVPAWLVAHGADINALDKWHETPLRRFCARRSFDQYQTAVDPETAKAVAWLMAHGADADLGDTYHQSPFDSLAGFNMWPLERQYRLPQLVARASNKRAVTALVYAKLGRVSSASLESQAAFDTPPSLLLLMRHALDGSFYAHLEVGIHRRGPDGGAPTVIPLTIDLTADNVDPSRWPVLQWGDVVVFTTDDSAWTDEEARKRYRALAAPQNRTVNLQLGGRAITLTLADPAADGMALHALWYKQYLREAADRPKPAVAAPPPPDPALHPVAETITAWTPVAKPLPSWTLSELVAHLREGEPRLLLDAARLERTVGGQTQGWTLDLRAANPAENETDEEGHPTGIRKVDVWLADGDRLSIPMIPADDPRVLEAVKNRYQTICLAAPGGLFAQKMFTRPPDNSATHTLGELLMQAYLSPMVIPNPNLSKIVIHRLTGNGAEEADLAVDLTQTILAAPPASGQAGPRQTDLPLQWGDRVEIPAIEGVELAKWKELSPVTQSYLKRCLDRGVKLTFNGQTMPGGGDHSWLAPEFEPYFIEDKMFPVRFTQRVRSDTGVFTALTLLRQLHVNLDTMVRFTLQAGGKTYDYDLKTLKAVNPWIGFDSQVNIQQLSP